ncbi:rho GTPase-activating protein 6-like isoform X1 [Notolabrus celidotus]|uniref:rho GTPase-activating protein 6-like isoform X1 n=1 Tax=Notolabrus celidotus TaxID=1203425 RepID=UPI00148F472E|nr:rho GTPase-activating protein 6-like isoform X1 [Notolabrus celidotus]
MSAAQGLLNSVFSCSSPNSKAITKRRLRQTRSLDPAIIRHCSTGGEGVSGASLALDAGASSERLAVKPSLRTRIPTLKEPISPSISSPSIPLDVSPSSNFHFDYDFGKRAKRNTAGDLPFLVRGSGAAQTGSTGTLFSPRRWLQRKAQPASSRAYLVWKLEGDFTWSSLSGRSVRLTPVAIQSLSELERARLQEVAFTRLLQDYDLGCQITMPKDGQKRKKSLRRKLDSLAKEKSKDKECIPQAFSIPLSQVIGNDRTHRQRQDSFRQDPPQREEHKDSSDLVSSIIQFATKRSSNKELSSSNSSLSSTSETANESTSPNTPEAAPRARRRGGMSVDSITDLDDNQSRLLEALQLSLPAETPSKKEKHRDKRLSLNPIYRQVPRVVDSCCQHIEKYGLQTVGIFRVGSSKKRVRQLREEFDRGIDVQLDEEHSIHDVAALLKEFLRDMPDPLLTKELYTAFINTTLLDQDEQQIITQLLVYLLPACNSDTLHRLLEFLSTVTDHAEDRLDKDRQEITGNKMTSLNLATIFGPNLLHKQKNSDKEFSVQSTARAEESTAVIAVLQRMIASYQTLFLVPPDLQNEVLMSLLETDPDVVDYLLRRKASQSPDLLQTEEPFTLSERRSSSDSNKASSGEVSPYDNNSPVLSERRGEPGSPGSEQLYRVPEHMADTWGSKDTISEEHANIWGTWHTTLKPALKDQPYTGSHGNMSEGSSRSSQEGLDGLHGEGRQQTTLQRTQTAPGVTDVRPHPPVTRVCTSPHVGRPRLQLSINPSATSHINSKHRAGGPGLTPASRAQGGANTGDGCPNDIRCPPPYNAHHRLAGTQSSPQLATAQQPPLQRGRLSGAQSNSASMTEAQMVPHTPEWQDWQRDRWQIWQLLSSDNADALPETLV